MDVPAGPVFLTPKTVGLIKEQHRHFCVDYQKVPQYDPIASNRRLGGKMSFPQSTEHNTKKAGTNMKLPIPPTVICHLFYPSPFIPPLLTLIGFEPALW